MEDEQNKISVVLESPRYIIKDSITISPIAILIDYALLNNIR